MPEQDADAAWLLEYATSIERTAAGNTAAQILRKIANRLDIAKVVREATKSSDVMYLLELAEWIKSEPPPHGGRGVHSRLVRIAGTLAGYEDRFASHPGGFVQAAPAPGTPQHRDPMQDVHGPAVDAANGPSKPYTVYDPAHYRQSGYEHNVVMKALLAHTSLTAHQGYLYSQMFKYPWRLGQKGKTKPSEDLGKAIWYATELRKELEAVGK